MNNVFSATDPEPTTMFPTIFAGDHTLGEIGAASKKRGGFCSVSDRISNHSARDLAASD